MPSSPHLSPKVVVLLISLALTVGATWVTLKLPETPEDPLGWFGTFLRRMVGGLWNGGRKRYYWAGILAYSVVVSVMHFGGLHYDVYIAIEHWDYLTHVISGAGVAMLLYLTFHLEGPDRRLRWIVPAVLAVGGGFEIYEFVFKNFWYGWTLRYYVLDTFIDLANNTFGSVVAVGLLGALQRWSGQRSK
jgi:hypothetical protein